jgi:hypothetical protein
MNFQIQEFAQKLASSYSAITQVQAVALGGSRAGPFKPDSLSDIDIYVYHDAEIPLSARQAIAAGNSTKAEIGNKFWEEGDEWIAREPALKVDVMFRGVSWIEDEVARVIERHEAKLGYSTCFLYNVQTCLVLYDRQGWLKALKDRASRPYPAALRDAILAKNHPVLRNNLSAYSRQIESAAERNDFVSINHRVAALLASYFDIVIAVNRLAHPGEKRLVQFVKDCCPSKPKRFEEHVASLLTAAPRGGTGVIAGVKALLDSLDDWLRGLGFLST